MDISTNFCSQCNISFISKEEHNEHSIIEHGTEVEQNSRPLIINSEDYIRQLEEEMYIASGMSIKIEETEDYNEDSQIVDNTMSSPSNKSIIEYRSELQEDSSPMIDTNVDYTSVINIKNEGAETHIESQDQQSPKETNSLKVKSAPKKNLNIESHQKKELKNYIEVLDDTYSICTKCTNIMATSSVRTHSDISCTRYQKVKPYLVSVGATMDCTTCSYTAPTIFDLHDHTMMEHARKLKKYACICGKTYTKEGKSKLFAHIYSKHVNVGSEGKETPVESQEQQSYLEANSLDAVSPPKKKLKIEPNQSEEMTLNECFKVLNDKHSICTKCTHLMSTSSTHSHSVKSCIQYQKIKPFLESVGVTIGCKRCSYTGPTILDLHDHMITEHGKRLEKFTCICKRTWSKDRKSTFFAHIYTHHMNLTREGKEMPDKSQEKQSPKETNSSKVVSQPKIESHQKKEKQLKDCFKVLDDKYCVCTKCSHLMFTYSTQAHSNAACTEYQKVKSFLVSVGATIDCTICSWTAPTIFDLHDHMIMEHGGRLEKYTCICGKTWNKEGKSKLFNHLYSHLKESKTAAKKNWTCLLCNVSEETMDRFVDHWKGMELPCWMKIQNGTSELSQQYNEAICQACGTMSEKKKIMSHYIREHTELVYYIEKIEWNLIEFYGCRVCGFKAKTKDEFCQHFGESCWNSTEDRPNKLAFGFDCGVCFYSFGDSKELEIHKKEICIKRSKDDRRSKIDTDGANSNVYKKKSCIKRNKDDSRSNKDTDGGNSNVFKNIIVGRSEERFHCEKCSMLILASCQNRHRLEICQRYTKVKQQLKEANVVNKCNFCNWEGPTMLDYYDHLIWHHEKQFVKIKCICGKELPSQCMYLEHITRVHPYGFARNRDGSVIKEKTKDNN